MDDFGDIKFTIEKVYVGTNSRKLRLKTYFNMLQWRRFEVVTLPLHIGLDAWNETR